VPLLPIDLQTLFSQANQVGKEQAVQKEASPTHQSLQGAQLVQKTEQRDNDVTETPTTEEGAEKIKDRERRAGRRGNRGGKEPKKSAAPAPAEKDVVRDPALGRNIDITS
jgi:hypothetical protein